jgi:G3E family GTPase
MIDRDALPSIPITVLTGFLGSGKTTLLRAALRSPALAGTLVLVNEIGEVGLDHLLVREVSEELVLLDSGCLCCTLRKDLVDQLGEIGERIRRGELTVKRVVIETTGLADPLPVLNTLLAHPAVASAFHVDGVVTTVDAQLGESNLQEYAECKSQIVLADRLILTKTDLVAEADCARIEAKLAELSPHATRIRSAQGAVHPSCLVDLGHLDTRSIAKPGCSAGEAHARPGHDADRPDHTHVDSIAVTLAQPVDFQSFALWVSMLTQLNGNRILRLKAIVHVRGEKYPIAVQAVQHLVYPPLDLPEMPELGGKSHVVILTTAMSATERDELVRSLHALSVAPPT